MPFHAVMLDLNGMSVFTARKSTLALTRNCSDVGLTTCFNYLFQNPIVYPPTHTGILLLLITSLMTDTFSKHLE